MDHYLSNPTNRHEPDLAEAIRRGASIAVLIKKAVARVRRREVGPLRRACRRVLDRRPICGCAADIRLEEADLELLKSAIAAVKKAQKGDHRER